MTTIVTRAGKGTPLSIAEMDANLTNLNNDKAELANPAFTGNPTAPTPTQGDNDTSIATTAFVNAEIAADRPYSDTNPLMDSTAAQGSSPRVSRQDHVHPSDTTKASLAGATFTGDVVMPSSNGGPLAGFRNKVINGAFDVWQRGTTFNPTVGGKCADMWNVSFDGTGGTRSISKWTHAAGEEIEGQFQYLRWVQTAAGTATYNSLEGLIEYVRTLNGKQVTLSFWAKADAARTLTCFIRQIFGSGGSASVDTASTNFNLTTSWAKYTYTVNLASISGKTLGTDSKLALIFLMPLTAFTIDITNVQLEAGSVATPFESRPLSVEQHLCYRYYYRLTEDSASVVGVGAGRTGSTLLYDIVVALPVVLRTKPTLETSAMNTMYLYGVSGTPNAISIDSATASVGAPRKTIMLTLTMPSVVTPGTCCVLTTAGFVAFSSEL